MSDAIARGTSSNTMRAATCKDCQRDIIRLERALASARAEGRQEEAELLDDQLTKKRVGAGTFSYSEHSASLTLDRGRSRSDRCADHRKKHRTDTQGITVAYVDLQTIGEALGADSDLGPTGPFGGLGPLPGKHEKQERTADLAEYEFGMTDVDVVTILELLRDDRYRVLVLRAGTGTGKSTFGPYRLMDPPTREQLEGLGVMEEVNENLAKHGLGPLGSEPFRIADLGPIVVTEPRVAAATGVSQFVGEKLAMGCKLKQCLNPLHGDLFFNPKAHLEDGLTGPSCLKFGKKNDQDRLVCERKHVGEHPGYADDARLPKACSVSDCSQHIGPGFPVGYQAKGIRHWDDSCQLVFATDGAVINWLRDGRLNTFGTVIVDEAHERSTNIDFILGYLKRDLAKYPHLRVIITSATFEPTFYEDYFGEYHPDQVAVMDVPAVKTVGYGLPMFPELDLNTDEMRTFLATAPAAGEPQKTWSEESRWQLVDEAEVDIDRVLKKHWATRYAPPLKEHEVRDPTEAKGGANEYIEDLWSTTKTLLALRLDPSQVIADTKDWRKDMPDLLADFVVKLEAGLLEAKLFGDILAFLPTEKMIDAAVQKIKAAVGDRADVLPLLSSLKEEEVDEALAARRKGDKRKIVVSTNLAETSLTVEGVRFVVDSGLIAQSEWQPELAAGRVATTLHSQSGIKQRWGRVGRKAPGWVFPLYTKKQFAELPADTPPGSARENLEGLMMTARLGGIDDVLAFPWPAAFAPTQVALDASAQAARDTFVEEMNRADTALRANGAVTSEGYPTALGKELLRFSALSTASAMAVMYADRLACVAEVITILALLDDKQMVGSDRLFLDDYSWPDEWRVEAYNRHAGLMSLAEDDAHLALLVCAAWEWEDPEHAPWTPSPKRERWCRQWWISNDVLLEAAAKRQEVLASLSPKMKKEARRFVSLSLLERARRVLERTMLATEFRLDNDAYVPVVIPPRLMADGTADRTPTRFTVESDSVMKSRPQRVLALRRRESRGGECLISGLVRLPDEGRTGGAHAASSTTDAMRMVVELQEQAAPDNLRNLALPVLENWPIGQRVRLRASDLAGEAAELKAEVEVVPPFEFPDPDAQDRRKGGGPGSQQKKGRRSGSEDDDWETAAASDGDRDFANRKARGAWDDEASEQRATARADREVGQVDRDAPGCGTCPPCVDQNPHRCVERRRIQERAKDVLAAKKAELKVLTRSALSSVVLDFDGEEPGKEAHLFEVTEYRNGDTEQPVVVLKRDWRADGAEADPSRHLDVRPGLRIPVVTAGTVRDHKDETHGSRPRRRVGALPAA